MSMDHYIRLVVTGTLSRDLLITLFKDAHRLGIQTLELSFNIEQKQMRRITADECADIIFEQIENIYFDRSITLKKDDAYFFIHVSSVGGSKLKISFSDFCRQWEKQYDAGKTIIVEPFNHIDLARYSRLILKLLEKYEILDFKIEYI